MQTFLPYPNFKDSAICLDNKRLNKQIIECYQILKALHGETKGWVNHPATLMWKGYENSLVCYGVWCCWVWKSRGFQTKLEEELVKFFNNSAIVFPWWVGLDKFHASHRSNLYRKDNNYYKKFQHEGNLPYCWPIEIDGRQIFRYKHAGDKKYLPE